MSPLPFSQAVRDQTRKKKRLAPYTQHCPESAFRLLGSQSPFVLMEEHCCCELDPWSGRSWCDAPDAGSEQEGLRAGSSQVEMTIIGAWDGENEATLRGGGEDGLSQLCFVRQASMDTLGASRSSGQWPQNSVSAGCPFRAPCLCSPDEAAEAEFRARRYFFFLACVMG